MATRPATSAIQSATPRCDRCGSAHHAQSPYWYQQRLKQEKKAAQGARLGTKHSKFQPPQATLKPVSAPVEPTVHPSWAAKRSANKADAAAFEGKKIVFTD